MPISPVTVAELKAHLRIDGDEEDSLLSAYLEAAAETVERYCGGRRMLRRAFTLTLDGFPSGGGGRVPIELPDLPAASVTSIVYTDSAGDDVTLDPSSYRLVAGAPRVYGEVEPVESESWPTDVIGERGRVVVSYTAGYGPSDTDASNVPAPMKLAVRQLAATWHRMRESVATVAASEVPHNVDLLLSTFRTPTL